MRISVCLALVMLLLIGGRALAQQSGNADCYNTAVTQFDLDACAGSDFEAADKELNKTYRELLSRLPDSADQNALKSAELAWIAFRDKDCEFEAGPVEGSGSIRPMVAGMCLADRTRARVAQLKSSLNCEEGDVSCRVSH
jgi:uncharacterized protein YecT (DUF1311 family)